MRLVPPSLSRTCPPVQRVPPGRARVRSLFRAVLSLWHRAPPCRLVPRSLSRTCPPLQRVPPGRARVRSLLRAVLSLWHRGPPHRLVPPSLSRTCRRPPVPFPPPFVACSCKFSPLCRKVWGPNPETGACDPWPCGWLGEVRWPAWSSAHGRTAGHPRPSGDNLTLSAFHCAHRYVQRTDQISAQGNRTLRQLLKSQTVTAT